MENITGKTQSLLNLIDYQDNSIVSKEILKKDKGNVTLFAFDKRQGLSEHTAPFDALVYILDGKVEIVISGETHIVATGEMIIMPANKPHALNAVDCSKILLVMIKT